MFRYGQTKSLRSPGKQFLWRAPTERCRVEAPARRNMQRGPLANGFDDTAALLRLTNLKIMIHDDMMLWLHAILGPTHGTWLRN